jgi:hypothetical protein
MWSRSVNCVRGIRRNIKVRCASLLENPSNLVSSRVDPPTTLEFRSCFWPHRHPNPAGSAALPPSARPRSDAPPRAAHLPPPRGGCRTRAPRRPSTLYASPEAGGRHLQGPGLAQQGPRPAAQVDLLAQMAARAPEIDEDLHSRQLAVYRRETINGLELRLARSRARLVWGGGVRVGLRARLTD